MLALARRLSMLGCLFAAVLTASEAPAQSTATIEVGPNQFTIERVDERPSGEFPLWINREDCVLDGVVGDGGTIIEVSPNLSQTGGQNLSLQVWVGNGVDCTDDDERRDTGRCWEVLNRRPQTNNVTYPISPRAVIAGRDPDTDSEAVCDKQVDWATTFYFLLLDGDGVIASAKWEETKVDTRAPAPPTSLEASGGESKIFLEWEVPTSDEESDTQGYTFFCVPVSGDAVVGQGGTTGTDGVAGAAGAPPVASNASCPTIELIPGELPPLSRRCGYATGRTVRNGQTADYGDEAGLVDIQDGQAYAVGIAAADQVGNEGALSDIVCATPEEVIDFFERYRDSGGRGGGGFCGLSPLGTRGGYGALVGLSALLSLGLLRRRRRLDA